MAKIWTANYKLNPLEWVLYYILYGMVILISLIPFCLLYYVSDAFCFLVRFIGYRKTVIKKNLHNSFPEKSDSEINDILNGFYQYFCDYIFETLKLATMNRMTMLRHMRYTGIEAVTDSVHRGQPVALYLGHYCNWEWVTSIGLLMPKETFGSQVYHVIESKVMDKLMLQLRSRMGTANVARADVLRRLIREMQNGKVPVVGFISDQSPIINSMPYWTEFLNQNTPFLDGTERLIKKFDMLPIYLDISRVKRGYYNIDVKVLAENTKDLEAGMLTELYVRALEKTIRRQPELWLWSHNRWKRRPEEFIKHRSSK